MNDNNGTISISTGTIIKTVLILLGFVVLYIIRDLVLIVMTSIVLAAAVEPMTKWLSDRRIHRTISVIGIYLFVAALIFSAFYFIFLPLLNQTSDFLGTVPGYLEQVEVYNPLPQGSLLGTENIVLEVPQALSLNDIAHQINVVANQFSGSAFGTISSVFGGVVSLMLILVLSFYMAVQHDGITDFLKTITPPKYRVYTLDLWKRSERKIGLWMQGQLLLIVIIGAITYIGLLLLGVPFALLLGVLSGLLELIPLFGPIIAAIPAVLIAYATGDFTLALLVVGLYVIVQQIENQFLYPMVVSKVVGVPALIAIIALIMGVQIAGFLGVILAVPVAAIIMELYKDLQKKQLEEERMAV